MSVNEASVQSALSKVVDANTGKDLTKAARNIKLSGNDVALEVELGYPGKSQQEPIRRQVVEALKGAGAANVSVKVTSKVVSHAVQRGVKLVPGIKNIIAVASGKGGVGKSTTAVNLALALAAEGASVGMLDADIYGPSQPTMLGIAGRPESPDGKTIEPMEAYGVQAMSIGFLIDVDTPMVWRGPMVTQALEQLLKDTRWRDLDYLIVGVVENMSIHVCSNCGHAEHIFGEGGAAKMCRDYGVPFLGSLPLDIRIREQADSGRPTVVADPDGQVAQMYREIARRTAVAVAQKASDFSAKFP